MYTAYCTVPHYCLNLVWTIAIKQAAGPWVQRGKLSSSGSGRPEGEMSLEKKEVQFHFRVRFPAGGQDNRLFSAIPRPTKHSLFELRARGEMNRIIDLKTWRKKKGSGATTRTNDLQLALFAASHAVPSHRWKSSRK